MDLIGPYNIFPLSYVPAFLYFSLTQCRFMHWALEADVQRPEKNLDNLDFNRFSGYKFRSASAKGACRSSAPRARKELRWELARALRYNRFKAEKWVFVLIVDF
ncbi:hypothetical protein TNCV_4571131 [Trichonephila clavipes]|nr:hypothetical protein TNCV_4571131 [Trichonephila clavipes]